jgi:hypothetical protein
MGGDARTPPTPTGGRKLKIKIMELKKKWHIRGGHRLEAGGTQQAVFFFKFYFYSGWDATAYKIVDEIAGANP